MRHHSHISRWSSVALLCASLAAPLGAQATSGDGYLFGAPIGSLTLRLGYARPSASSDLFGYTTNLLSLSKGDFAGVEIGADLGFMQGDHLEWLISADVATRSADSDYRDYIGSDGLPINQSTTFVRVPILFGARYWFNAPGTRIGTLAWVPTRIAPFVGLQGGMMWYEFRQNGDFVDFNNGNNVFAGDLRSNGWAPTAAVSAGVAVALNPHFSLLTQARYLYAKRSLGADFTGFQPIDLSGLSMTVGLTYRMR
jgi:hypothetical protein